MENISILTTKTISRGFLVRSLSSNSKHSREKEVVHNRHLMSVIIKIILTIETRTRYFTFQDFVIVKSGSGHNDKLQYG